MGGTWLPSWLGLAWTTVFAAVLAVHLRHMVVMAGRNRLWHGAHVLVAAAMIVMVVPADRMILPAGWGAAIFGVVATTVAGGLFGSGTLRGSAGRLWLLVVLDMAAMAYMFAMASAPTVAWLSVALAALSVLQAWAWYSGRLGAYLASEGLGAAAGGRSRGGGGRMPTATDVEREAHSPANRATLTLMGLGMAYMLLAMQFGSGAMAGM